MALVLAENEEIAEKASQLVKVEFEDLPLVPTIEKAMEPDAFLLHPEKKTNDLCKFRIRYGDVEEGFKQSDVIIESDYETPAQEHAYLQPEAGLSYIDEEGRITVIVSGQWVHEDREQIAHSAEITGGKSKDHLSCHRRCIRRP